MDNGVCTILNTYERLPVTVQLTATLFLLRTQFLPLRQQHLDKAGETEVTKGVNYVVSVVKALHFIFAVNQLVLIC